jgi:zinc metalloprotease ZmpA
LVLQRANADNARHPELPLRRPKHLEIPHMKRPIRLTLQALAFASVLTVGNAAYAADAESRARAHIADFPGRSLHAPGHSYALRDAIVDHAGAEHVRFDRQFRGLRVIGGDLIVHTEAGGSLRGITHTLSRAIDVSLRASLPAADAITAALASHPGDARGAPPELLVYARGDRPVLAYDIRIDSIQADDTPSEKHVIVDAGSGVVLEAWDDIQTAPATGTGNTLHTGDVPLSTNSTASGFSMVDPTRGNNSTRDMRNRQFGQGAVFTDADNNWGDNTTADRATVGSDAHYGVTTTWDYYKNVHGRNGIANDGVGAQSRVHYGRNYANAFWSDSCFCMTYGDGNTQIKPLTSLDVAGHEMTHGVTSRTAALVYSGESGGLNEATSDIFGTMVEFYANNANDPGDYLIGEKLFANGTSVIRNMIRPSVDGVSADCFYPGVGGIDVHYSSGIANHFFYLLAEGTTGGNPSPTCVAGNTRVATGTGTVSGIGRAKAEKIWYVALTQFMTSSTNYAQARTATLNASNSLYGAASPESNAVAAAWSAVLVN